MEKHKISHRIIIKLNIEFSIQPLCCSICGQPILPNQQISLDHHIPRCHGGKDEASNLLPAHKICNSIKNDLMPEEFEKRKKQLYQDALDRWHIKQKDKLILINALKIMEKMK